MRHLALILLVAAGCGTTETAMRQQREQQARAAAQAAELQAANDACVLQFPEGASQQVWDACMRTEIRRMREQAEARRLAVRQVRAEEQAAQAIEDAEQRRRWQAAGQFLQQVNQPAPAPAPAPRPAPVSCTTNTYGQTAYTNCY